MSADEVVALCEKSNRGVKAEREKRLQDLVKSRFNGFFNRFLFRRTEKEIYDAAVNEADLFFGDTDASEAMFVGCRANDIAIRLQTAAKHAKKINVSVEDLFILSNWGRNG